MSPTDYADEPASVNEPDVATTGDSDDLAAITRELDDREFRAAVESLLFASKKPVTATRISKTLGAQASVVRETVGQLAREYDEAGHAFEIAEIAGGYQLLTRGRFHDLIEDFEGRGKKLKLSKSALETLAVVAYRQPVLRVRVDDIRGVQAGPVLRTLCEVGLIRIVGRSDAPGRPLLYGTTRRFLDEFGLKSLKDLPEVADLAAKQPGKQPRGETESPPPVEDDAESETVPPQQHLETESPPAVDETAEVEAASPQRDDDESEVEEDV